MARKRSDPITAYAQAVKAGRIAAGKPVRQACERHLRDLKRKDLRWRPEKAQLAIDFFQELLVLDSGEPFKLQPYQQFIIGSVFGWYGTDGFRRFRTGYVEMGKGSGKSPLAAGVGLYGLVADGEPAPEVYAAANDFKQAKIVFGDAVHMVEGSPELKDLIHSQVGSLTIAEKHAVFRPVSSEHKGLDGLRVHMALVDEIHEHPTSLVVDKIRAGTKGRRNALIFEITNSGWDRTSVCWHHHEHSLKVLEGTIQNDSWFAYVCALDEGDDWKDEAVWLKANPGLGVTIPMKYLREQVAEAVGMPSKENLVRRLNFCEWTEQADRWLDMTLWDACPAAPVDKAQLDRRACMAGLDAASTSDLTALVLLFGPDAGGFYDALARFWIPQATLDAKDSGRTEQDRLRLLQWAQEGWVTTTGGDTTDYDVVEKAILDDLKLYRLERLSFDRWNITQLVTHLQDALGQDRVVEFPQTMAHMTAPTKALEKVIKDGKLRHGGNPVLRWMASNVALAEGPNGQCKPDRKRSGEKIDGIIALIEALDGSIHKAEAPKPSLTFFGEAQP